MTDRAPFWGIIAAVAAIGLAAQLSLAIADARSSRAPAHDDPGYWLWAASPSIAWGLAGFGFRRSWGAVALLIAGATLGELGGWGLLWSDFHHAKSPGGMNPFASNNLVFTVVISAFPQWVTFAIASVIAGVIWLRDPSRGRLRDPTTPPHDVTSDA
jgi:hypothetical protein